MSAFAPGQARRLDLACGLALALTLATAACTPADRSGRAARLDRTYGTAAFAWLTDHEPSRLDVSGLPVSVIEPFDPGARLRAVSAEPRRACREAKRDRALLLVVADLRVLAVRDRVLDCGFALQRDAGAAVLAPR